MKKLPMIALFLTCLSVFTTASAQEQESVFTLYFSGTAMTGDMWDETKSAFGRAETVATMHHFQKAGTEGHFKAVVDGFANEEIEFPNWANKSTEALERLAPVFEDTSCSNCITLNLIGFSRGAVSTMHLAHQLSENSEMNEKIGRMNILVFDPVPGALLLSREIFRLPSKVANFLGFYSADERTVAFSPVFPQPTPTADPLSTRVHFFAVPGSHETMVGSIKKDGHAHLLTTSGGVDSVGSAVEDIDSLDHLSTALKLVTKAILGSSEWGGVVYDEGAWIDELGENQLKVALEEEINAIYSPTNINLYSEMRGKSFIDRFGIISPTAAWRRIPVVGETCALGSKINSTLSSTAPRCAYFEPFDGRLGLANGSIENVDMLIPLNGKNEDGKYEIVRMLESYD